MDKKNGSRTIGFILFCVVLWVIKDLVILWPWLGIPFGLVCVFFPKAAWMVTGGFMYMPAEPSRFALSTRRSFGFFLILYTMAKVFSNSVHGV